MSPSCRQSSSARSNQISALSVRPCTGVVAAAVLASHDLSSFPRASVASQPQAPPRSSPLRQPWLRPSRRTPRCDRGHEAGADLGRARSCRPPCRGREPPPPSQSAQPCQTRRPSSLSAPPRVRAPRDRSDSGPTP
ncbi:vegetative cell wall protein gp1-like [Iris pallida]|uniref:Vegetative cell wall protein gp1-like n=1 Tax=Iris pallida TaxID=29817 RepID=A0AAX6E8B3_IRIPA|nr:vegetative cell wall protein gp1-like [Iris pallida]